jgi:hypothetical protein
MPLPIMGLCRNWRLHRYATGSNSVIGGRCDNVFGWIGPVGVLAMNSVHHGWFFNTKEWIEFIAAAVVLWLLMMTVIAGFDLRSAG